MDKDEKIVVYKVYESAINANIAKTKLDAYGIPCSLFGEEVSNLYPMLSHGFTGIYLKVFEEDLPRVKEILEDVDPIQSITCPHCQSIKVTFNGAESILSKISQSIMLLLHVRVGHRDSFTCNRCKKIFKVAE